MNSWGYGLWRTRETPNDDERIITLGRTIIRSGDTAVKPLNRQPQISMSRWKIIFMICLLIKYVQFYYRNYIKIVLIDAPTTKCFYKII